LDQHGMMSTEGACFVAVFEQLNKAGVAALELVA
jgi:hypothetical protein